MLNMCSLVCAAEAAPAQEMCTFNPLSVCVCRREKAKDKMGKRERSKRSDTDSPRVCYTT